MSISSGFYEKEDSKPSIEILSALSNFKEISQALHILYMKDLPEDLFQNMTEVDWEIIDKVFSSTKKHDNFSLDSTLVKKIKATPLGIFLQTLSNFANTLGQLAKNENSNIELRADLAIQFLIKVLPQQIKNLMKSKLKHISLDSLGNSLLASNLTTLTSAIEYEDKESSEDSTLKNSFGAIGLLVKKTQLYLQTMPKEEKSDLITTNNLEAIRSLLPHYAIGFNKNLIPLYSLYKTAAETNEKQIFFETIVKLRKELKRVIELCTTRAHLQFNPNGLNHPLAPYDIIINFGMCNLINPHFNFAKLQKELENGNDYSSDATLNDLEIFLALAHGDKNLNQQKLIKDREKQLKILANRRAILDPSYPDQYKAAEQEGAFNIRRKSILDQLKKNLIRSPYTSTRQFDETYWELYHACDKNKDTWNDILNNNKPSISLLPSKQPTFFKKHRNTILFSLFVCTALIPLGGLGLLPLAVCLGLGAISMAVYAVISSLTSSYEYLHDCDDNNSSISSTNLTVHSKLSKSSLLTKSNSPSSVATPLPTKEREEEKEKKNSPKKYCEKKNNSGRAITYKKT